jgi:hypothetical protein
MTIAAILALAVVALAGGAYAYLVYSPKPQMPSLSSEVQHATMRVGDRSGRGPLQHPWCGTAPYHRWHGNSIITCSPTG